LKRIFPSETFIHDKVVPNSNTKTRPDYRCEKLKLIIEFDGDQHYRNVKKLVHHKDAYLLVDLQKRKAKWTVVYYIMDSE
jgi:very-short-patch-repair endonuclease